MEKKIKTIREEHLAIPAREAYFTEKQKEVWVARDGKELETDWQCKEYEKYLDLVDGIKHIPHKEIKEFQYEGMYSQWYFIATPEDKDALFRYFGNRRVELYGKPFEYGIWHGFSLDDRGDYRAYYQHTTLQEEIDEREDELALLRSIPM